MYRLCLGKTSEGKSGYCYLLPTLASMLSFLEQAQCMKPAKRVSLNSINQYHLSSSLDGGLSNTKSIPWPLDATAPVFL